MQRVAIIGNGNVGSALKRGLQRAGIDAPATGKDPQRVQELAQQNDVLILAVPWTEHDSTLKEMGRVDGKILVDVSNAMDDNGEFADPRPSLAEQLQLKAGRATVVKAFNTVFAQNMSDGRANGEVLTLFVAGDDAGAKAKVEDLGRRLGFDPVDVGPLSHARWLETLGFLNIRLGYGQEMGTDIGFRLVRPKTKQAQTPAATR